MKRNLHSFLALTLMVGLASEASAVTRMISQASQPATCNTGDMWIDTDGTSGERVYTCESANTWVKNLGVGPTSNPSFNSVHASGGNMAAANKQVTKAWASGLPYIANLTSVIYGGKHYICTSTHTAGSTTEPGVGASWATVWTESTGTTGATAINDLTDVDTTGKAAGKILKFDASGNLIVGTDDTGSGSVPSGTVNGQILQWSTDQWVAGAIPTLNQNTTGSAATLTNARTIGGVSFNGSANINLPGVNASGTQNTSGNAGTATALAANGANCSAGQAALGVDASGAAEGCWTPSAGSMSWPAAAGIAVYGGSSAWGTSLTLDTDISSVSASDDSVPSAKATKAALDLKANASSISFVAGALSDMKILDTAQPANGSVWVDDTLAYGGTDDQLHLWSIDKIGSMLAGKQAADADLTTWAGVTPGTGVGTFLATPSGANLASALTSALPATKGGTGLTALGTGVATAMGNATGGTGGFAIYDADMATAASTTTFTNKTYDVGATGNSFTDVYELPVTIISPADTDDPLIDKVKRAVTLTGMDCVALGSGTISVDLQECNADGASCATTGANIASCGATNTNDAALTDTAIASGAWLKLVIGAPTGTVSQVSVKVYGEQVK